MAVMLVALLIGLAFPPCALMDKGLNEDVVLVPLLRGFANNQIVGLKEVMALGRVLGIKVAMQGIIESTHEHRPPTREGKKMVHYGSRVIPFGDLFDEAIINDANKLTTIDALVEGGWDKTLGMVIYLGAKGSDKVWLGRWQDVYGVQVFSGPVQKSEGGFRCSDQEEMDALKASIMRHKFVGISTFEGIVGLHRNLPGEEWLFPENPTPCQRAYMEITMEMERSKKIKRLADDFIRRNFGAAPFLALHVRPYPDTCISLWKDKVWNERYAASATKCDRVHNGWAVYKILRPAVNSLVVKIGSGPKVFVMAEPGIRARVNFLLGDVKEVYASVDMVLDDVREAKELAQRLMDQDLEESEAEKINGDDDDEEEEGRDRAREPESEEVVDYFLQASIKLQAGVISTLGLLEEEIASRAELFVTTSAISSMSGMVIQQRSAEGKPNSTTLTFSQLARMGKGWPWPWSPSSDDYFCYFSTSHSAPHPLPSNETNDNES